MLWPSLLRTRPPNLLYFFGRRNVALATLGILFFQMKAWTLFSILWRAGSHPGAMPAWYHSSDKHMIWVLREATESICPFHPFFHFWLLHVSLVNLGSIMVGSCVPSSLFPFMFCLILWQRTCLFCTRQISHLG
jgi:hypothetical protein